MAHLGGLAQLVERLLCKQDVSGSSPLTSTNFTYRIFLYRNRHTAPHYVLTINLLKSKSIRDCWVRPARTLKTAYEQEIAR
jgi:hypothetical protein